MVEITVKARWARSVYACVSELRVKNLGRIGIVDKLSDGSWNATRDYPQHGTRVFPTRREARAWVEQQARGGK